MEKDLFAAVITGNQIALRKVLGFSTLNVNCLDKEGRTAVFHASLEGKEDIVQILLDAGADITICSTKDGDTPLIIACSEGHSKVAQKLILAGAQVNGPNRGGWTPLIYAAYYNHKEVVLLLLSHNADINQTSNTGCSALYRASTSNKPAMVRLLIEAGADINLATTDGRTPLGVACWYGYAEVVRVLLEAGADVDIPNLNGNTPLHEALENEHYATIELLLMLGHADPTLPDAIGRTPLELARSEAAIHLIRNALKAQKIRSSLRELQQCQPQLTQLTHTVRVVPSVLAELDPDQASHSVQLPTAELHDTYTSREFKGPTPDVIANTSIDDRLQNEDSRQLNTEVSSEALDVHSDSSSRRASARRSAQLSAAVLGTLNSLAQASPLTIECLKQFGASAVQAEHEYEFIRRDPTLYEYYLFFIQAVSSAVLASQSIASGMIDDARLSTAEQVMEGIDVAAQAVSWMGAPLVTGIGKFLIAIPHTRERQRTIRRIVTYFPSVDSHKYIEILARELTIFLAKDIRAVLRETKRQSKASILEKVMKVVEWMNTATNLSAVQGYACGHAARLIDTMMCSDGAFAVEFQHISQLMQWASSRDAEEIKMRHEASAVSPVSPNLPMGVSPLGSPVSVTTDTASRSLQSESPRTPGDYAEKEEMDGRICILERKLSMENHERVAVEKRYIRDISALQKQMKGLEAVNQIFSGISDSGGLVGAQSAETIHKTIGEHLKHQAVRQSQQGELLQELAVRMELLVEDNGLRAAGRVEVSGGNGGSAIYAVDKGPERLGSWVNGKVSLTADLSPSLPVPYHSAKGPSAGSARRSRPLSTTSDCSKGRRDAADEDVLAMDTGGCCSIS